ncbi:hypothetical protein [Microcoleus sp. LEGE 07076]|nr:hypothetical protein [Microcoleus sp. LEGE 07076]
MPNFVVGQLAGKLTGATVDVQQESGIIDDKAIAARSAAEV